MRSFKGLSKGVCAGLLLFAGVAVAQDHPTNSGFLGDAYPKLLEVKSPSKQKVKRWLAPEVVAANYDSLMLQPTVLYPEPQGTEQASMATLNEIRAYMDVALKRELADVITLVNELGPRTLKLRPAITAAAAKDMGLKPYQYMPIAFVVTLGQTTKKATLAVEYEVQDSSTGKVIGAGMRESAGQDIKSMNEKLTLENVKPAVDVWAKDARAFIAAGNFKK
jgi:hypothetical protein